LVIGIASTEFIFGNNNKSVTVNVQDMKITGAWDNIIEIEDHDYEFEVMGSIPRVNVNLKLKQTFRGAMEDPSITFILTPLSADGKELYELRVESTDRFNSFIQGQVGDTDIIAFVGNKVPRSFVPMPRKEWVSKIKSFGAKTIDPAQASASAAAAVAVASDRRTGLIVAIPELTSTQNVPQDIILRATASVTSGLLMNRSVQTIVDYNQMAVVQRQLQFEASDWSNTDKYAEIGKVLNIDTIAVGNVISSGSRYIVSLQLINISTLAVVGAYTSPEYSSSGMGNIENNVKRMNVKK